MDFLKRLEQVQNVYNETVNSQEAEAPPAPAAPVAGRPPARRRRKGPAMRGAGTRGDPEYAKKAEAAVCANVRMISGCQDAQTSADVQDVSSFGLPDSEGAGGACTNALLLSAAQGSNTWTSLLQKMQAVLKTKKYTQIPQLSTSRDLDLSAPFDIMLPDSKNHKALLIGINYVGQQGELKGCHNDVEAMKEYIIEQGYTDSPDTMMVLMDDGKHKDPTAANLAKAFAWLVDGAQEGDSLFMHYSGHGGSMPDDESEEADAKDETMVPLDYQTVGQIRDDDLYKMLVAPLPVGVEMTIVMDCCHSGSIFDLPYNIAMTGDLVAAVEAGEQPSLVANENFSVSKVLKVAMDLYKMQQAGNTDMMAMGQTAAKALGLF
ncbi:Metacapase [Tribonema minus]|uniref:Metacapase n=1 Tax=Tribonema minus TaxID=303371 RepID=A0A836C803_9STRA|nr:Metacapase [Tribonema minus]